MFLTCDNGLISAIFLRNLRVQNTKPVRPLRSLYDTIDQCDMGWCADLPGKLCYEKLDKKKSENDCMIMPENFN